VEIINPSTLVHAKDVDVFIVESGKIVPTYDKAAQSTILAAGNGGATLRLPSKDYVGCTIASHSCPIPLVVHKFACPPVNLAQRCLVLQVFLTSDKPFTLALTCLDSQNVRQRFVLSTAFREPSSTPLHTQVPLPEMQRGCWISFGLDLEGLLNACCKQSFKSTEEIRLGAVAKLRRIFTVPTLDSIPAKLQFSHKVPYIAVLFDSAEISGFWAARQHESKRANSQNRLSSAGSPVARSPSSNVYRRGLVRVSFMFA